MSEVVELESLGVRGVLESFWEHQRELAKMQAASIGKANDKVDQKAIDGIGERIASIPIGAFHFWGQKLGYECWNDAGFIREFLKDNPGLKAKKTSGTRMQVGFGS